MSQMLEKAALAIYDQLLEKGGGGRTMVTWQYAPERAWCLATARAVIAAMQEPTQEMLDMAYDGAYGAKPVARFYWQEMIKAVLS